MATTQVEHKIFYGAFNNIGLLVLNAKSYVATSLAPNLQMSLMDVIFLQKNGATKESDTS